MRKKYTRTVEYVAWQNMCSRCYSKNFRQYADYGGRGIKVFDGWRGKGGFALFFAYIGLRPSPEYTLDRIDNNKNYEPGNVRWATRKEQNNNCRKNVYLTVDGMTKSVSEWAEYSGIKRSTIKARLELGWEVKEAIFTPNRSKVPNGQGKAYHYFRARKLASTVD